MKRAAVVVFVVGLLIVALLSLAAPRASAQTPSDLTDGLVSCWDFEEESGTRYDAWGENDLTDNNSVTRGNGVTGYAADFVAANSEYLSVTDNSTLDLVDQFTIATWSNLNTDHIARLVSKYDVSGNRSFVLRTTSSLCAVFSFSADGTNITNVESAACGTAANWLFVVASYDATTVHVGVNNSYTTSNRDFDLFNSGAPLTIGGVGSYLDGMIDTTAIWLRALSNDDVTWLYNSGNGRSCADIINTAPPPTPTPTITPTPTPTATPGPLIYAADLPSGGSGTMTMEVSAGDVGVILAVGLLAVLNVVILISQLVKDGTLRWMR